MIFIDRKPPVTRFRDMKEYKILRKSFSEFYRDPLISRRQKVFKEEKLSKLLEDSLMEALMVQFKKKCAFCETAVDRKTSKICHYRPIRNSKNPITQMTHYDGYWWLAYEWSNLYLSCADCSRYKASIFPVINDAKKGELDQAMDVREEKTLLLDPCVDRPEQHLAYGDLFEVIPLSKSGEASIEILQLNRSSLQRNRTSHGTRLNKILLYLANINKLQAPEKHKTNIRSLLRELISVFSGTAEFSAMKIGMFESWIRKHEPVWRQINQDAFFQKALGDDYYLVDDLFEIQSFDEFFKVHRPPNASEGKAFKSNNEILKRAFIRRVEINNFKSIRDVKLDFLDMGVTTSQSFTEGSSKTESQNERWLMMLGENSVGKSSILQAITLCLAGQRYIDDQKFVPSDFIRHETKSGFVKIYLEGMEQPIELSFTSKAKKFTSTVKEPPGNVLAYGSTRLVHKKLVPEPRLHRISAMNLFDPAVGLTASEQWLLQLTQDQFNNASIALKQLLGKGNEDVVVKKNGKIKVKSGDYEASIDELSDGYKYSIALAIDMMSRLSKEQTSFETVGGIVLLDEIGTHLHPTWKMRVVSQLKKVFPKIQFIVTTHDPLCLKGLAGGEIVVFRKDRKGVVNMITDVPEPGMLRADQILSSEFFGLNSTIDPEMEDIFNEYYELLASKKLSAKESKRLDELKKVLKDKNQLGATVREELMLDAIDKVISTNLASASPAGIPDLKITTQNLIKSIWEEDEEKKPKSQSREVKIVKTTPLKNADDPWKGRFGGKSSGNNRILTAAVEEIDDGWYGISIEVRSTNKNKPLKGEVHFFLHDTFVQDKPVIKVRNGVARHYVEGYGAFTVGAVTDKGKTRLELDLAENTSFPEKFRLN